MALLTVAPMSAEKVSPLRMMKEYGLRVKSQGLRVRGEGSRVKDEESSVKEKVARMASPHKMTPGVTKTFGWDGEQWMPEDTYSYTYDGKGNVTVENAENADGGYVRTVSEYDSNDMLTFKETKVSDNGTVYENNSKTSMAYDPILTKVITDREEWKWIDDEWQQNGNNYRRIITRDGYGNITSSVIAVLFQGIYDPTQRVDVVYGEDGKACEISEQILNFNYDTYEYYWEQGVKISDIVWERTDGQIYNVDDLFIGNNRIGSARYVDPDGLDMNVTAEYADDSDAYTATMSMTMDDMTVTATSEYIPLENDGYIGIGTTYFMGEVMYSSREEVRYDDWGLMTLEYEEETEDDMTYYQKTVGDVEYDEEGRPEVYTISEAYVDEDTGKEMQEYVIRAEYSDYVDVTNRVSSVENVPASEKRYDLNGLPVSTPEKGRIIVTESGEKRVF